MLGANGQVGGELCLLMSLSDDVAPVAVARSEYSLALLRKLGIDCRVAHNNEKLVEIVKTADAVVDLVHPWHDDTRRMRQAISDRIDALCGAVSRSSPFIYASTMSVYRLDPEMAGYTVYGSTKLFAERQLKRACRKIGAPLFILRLGQVHGAMQGCSVSIQQQLSDGEKAIVPSIPSFTVFVSSISEAIEQILRSRVEPGTYTMISDPAWSYKELLEWLAQDAGVEVSVAVEPSTTSRLGMLARLKSFIGNTAVYHKEYLAEIAMRYAPVYFERYRQNHRAKISGAQILEFEAILCKQYFSQKVSIPGQRIACLSDSRQSMPLKHRGLKKMIAQLTE